MTVRPRRRSIYSSVGEAFDRVRVVERFHHGPWIYVGSGVAIPGGLTAPAFENSWANIGGGEQLLRFRWLQGGGIEIEGAVDGGADGSVVFTLPDDPLYRDPYADGIKTRPASDSSGSFRPYRIHTDGTVTAGF